MPKLIIKIKRALYNAKLGGNKEQTSLKSRNIKEKTLSTLTKSVKELNNYYLIERIRKMTAQIKSLVNYQTMNWDKFNQPESEKLITNLKKYETYPDVSSQSNNYFGKINQTVFDNELFNTKEIGLYAWLSGTALIDNNNNHVVRNLSTATILDMFRAHKYKKNNQWVEDTLRNLSQQALIELTPTFKSGSKQFFDITMIEPDKSASFAKVYTYSIDKIVSESTGINTLKHIGLYAAIRSFVFEHDNDVKGWVVDRGEKILADQSQLAINTYHNNLNWLLEHEILSYFVGTKKSKKPEQKGYKKMYLAEMADHCILTGVIKGYVEQGELTWADTDYKSAIADVKPTTPVVSAKDKSVIERLKIEDNDNVRAMTKDELDAMLDDDNESVVLTQDKMVTLPESKYESIEKEDPFQNKLANKEKEDTKMKKQYKLNRDNKLHVKGGKISKKLLQGKKYDAPKKLTAKKSKQDTKVIVKGKEITLLRLNSKAKQMKIGKLLHNNHNMMTMKQYRAQKLSKDADYTSEPEKIDPLAGLIESIRKNKLVNVG